MKEIEKTLCPVCGQTELEEFDFCPVCGWCNDRNQAMHRDLEGGGNRMSLNQAIEAWINGEKID